MIRVSHLRKTFDRFLAVDDLSFSVARGEVLGFLGPNGAGKSTTMKMITGFLRPDGGTVHVGDVDVLVQPHQAQKLIGYLPEGAPAWPEMTPRAFLAFIAQIRDLSGAAAQKAISRAVAITQLQAVLDQPIETLSKGFRRRVGLAQAILHDPPVLIMDEPTDGLDPNQKHHVRQAIAEMAADKAIIISTHILEEVDALCARVLIISHGQEVATGTPAEIAAMSHYCGAISVTVSRESATMFIEQCSAWTNVDRLEHFARGSDVSATLFPVAGQSDAVLSRLQAQVDIPLKSLSLEDGRLDDVFRRITERDQ